MTLENTLLGILQVGIIGFCGVMLVDFVDRKLDPDKLFKKYKKR